MNGMDSGSGSSAETTTTPEPTTSPLSSTTPLPSTSSLTSTAPLSAAPTRRPTKKPDTPASYSTNSAGSPWQVSFSFW